MTKLSNWEDVRKELCTPEQLAISDFKCMLIKELTDARYKMGLSQKKLEELSGVKQPIIARMEKGVTTPQLETFLKLLAALGKTIKIEDLEKNKC